MILLDLLTHFPRLPKVASSHACRVLAHTLRYLSFEVLLGVPGGREAFLELTVLSRKAVKQKWDNEPPAAEQVGFGLFDAT